MRRARVAVSMFFSSSIKGVADVMTASTPMALTRPYTPPARAHNEHTQHDGDRRGADVHKVKPTATAGRPTHVHNTHKGAHTELTAAEHTVQATRQEQQTRVSTEDNHGTKKPKKRLWGATVQVAHDTLLAPPASLTAPHHDVSQG